MESDNVKIVIIYKSYSKAQSKATMKYREAHMDEYKQKQKEYYIKRKNEDDFKEKKKEQNRLNYLKRKKVITNVETISS